MAGMNDETKRLFIRIGNQIAQYNNRSVSVSHDEDRLFRTLLDGGFVGFGNSTSGIDGVVYLNVELTSDGEHLYSSLEAKANPPSIP